MVNLERIFKELDRAIDGQEKILLAHVKADPLEQLRYLAGYYHGLQTAKQAIIALLEKGGEDGN